MIITSAIFSLKRFNLFFKKMFFYKKRTIIIQLPQSFLCFTKNGPHLIKNRQKWSESCNYFTHPFSKSALFRQKWSVFCKNFTHLFSKEIQNGPFLTKVVRILHKFHPPFFQKTLF